MNRERFFQADKIHVKGESYEGRKLLRCGRCGERAIGEFDSFCKGCGAMFIRPLQIKGDMQISKLPPIIEVDELPKFSDVVEFIFDGEVRE